MTRRKT